VLCSWSLCARLCLFLPFHCRYYLNFKSVFCIYVGNENFNAIRYTNNILSNTFQLKQYQFYATVIIARKILCFFKYVTSTLCIDLTKQYTVTVALFFYFVSCMGYSADTLYWSICDVYSRGICWGQFILHDYVSRVKFVQCSVTVFRQWCVSVCTNCKKLFFRMRHIRRTLLRHSCAQNVYVNMPKNFCFKVPCIQLLILLRLPCQKNVQLHCFQKSNARASQRIHFRFPNKNVILKNFYVHGWRFFLKKSYCCLMPTLV